MVLIKRTMENIHQIAIKCLHNKRDLDNKQKPALPPPYITQGYLVTQPLHTRLTYCKVGNEAYHGPRGLLNMIWPMGSNSHRIKWPQIYIIG